MSVTPSRARQRLRKAFEDTYYYLRSRGAPLPASARLEINCAVARRLRDRDGDPRAFAHIMHKGKWTLCVVEEAGRLPDSHLYGIMLHEWGHPLASRLYGRSEQEDADKAIWSLSSTPILYKSSLCLQWVTAADVRRIKSRR